MSVQVPNAHSLLKRQQRAALGKAPSMSRVRSYMKMGTSGASPMKGDGTNRAASPLKSPLKAVRQATKEELPFQAIVELEASISQASLSIKQTEEDFIEDEDEIDTFEEVGRLKDGKSFGELALISHKPRAATIKALTDVFVAVVHKNDY